ncbi:pyridoxal-phosphate dependent enzyme family protein [hydrothermal vent metagenome]|uniref:Pyridoxal-phosphate dependent enzyme family protein n=1 Tax=hydrothermal vent metagenome TaxID=652676 RepID=A0A3B0R1L8_9ZZZZ
MGELPDIEDVRAAARRLRDDALVTPLLRSDQLDLIAGRQVWVKAECLQYTGSFKYRGARNRILCLTANEKANGVVAYSSGNHAQGVALAAKRANLPCCIVMPADTPQSKINGVLARDGEVVFYDRLHQDRAQIAADIAADRNAVLIPPYDDPFVIAGQGTVGLEIVEQAKQLGVELQALIPNTGGGGLTAGIALALEAERPDCTLYSCEPEGFDDHKRSLISGKRERNLTLDGSICDALMAQQPGQMTFAINQSRLRVGFSVSESQVRDAMRFAYAQLQLVVEPGGAASLAAVLAKKVPGSAPICIVLTGGNVDPILFAEIINADAG